MTLDRRSFLKSLILASTVAKLAPALAAEQPRFSIDPFGLGVASGSPSPDGFVLWTRLLDPILDSYPAINVNWEVWEEGRRDRLVAQGVAVATKVLAHSVHVEIAGLKPNCRYEYRFMVKDAVSDTGKTRTMPTPGSSVNSWRIAFASCQRWEHGFYAAYRHMLADRPDMVLFLGDYIYEYAGSNNPIYPRTHALRRIKNIEDYRERYALYKSDKILQKIHAACPWLVTWDDHEVENNYSGIFSTEGSPRFASLRDAAYQAFYEHMPLRRKALIDGVNGLLSGKELRLYDALDIGDLARIHLLDNRQYRGEPLCGDKPSAKLAQVCLSEMNEQRSMLGSAQDNWLMQSLLQARTDQQHWNFIAQQTRFTPSNYQHGSGKRFSVDSWDGFPESRLRLIQALQTSKAINPVIIGGDIHQNWVAHVHVDPYNVDSPIIASEFTGTSISSRGIDQSSAERILTSNPHCILANSTYRGYGLLDVSPNKMEVALRVVSDVNDPYTSVRNLAEYMVKAGDPRIIPR